LAECVVVSKDDVIRYMLSLPILKGRIGKWILALSEFDLRYESAKAVKGQAIADFVVQHCGPELNMVRHSRFCCATLWTRAKHGRSCSLDFIL
jgi:hypothetical protein